MSESPRYLIQKSQLKEAGEIIIQIRNTNPVDEENYEIKSNFEEMKRSHEMTGKIGFIIFINQNGKYIPVTCFISTYLVIIFYVEFL